MHRRIPVQIPVRRVVWAPGGLQVKGNFSLPLDPEVFEAAMALSRKRERPPEEPATPSEASAVVLEDYRETKRRRTDNAGCMSVRGGQLLEEARRVKFGEQLDARFRAPKPPGE